MVAIDTSGAMSGLAILDEHQLLAETRWQSDRRHSEQVIPHLDDLCRLVDSAPSQITHVAVNIGPGSWSGIRVGISIAKGLAIANNAIVVGISALDVLAWPLRHMAPLTVVVALGRGRFATATYEDSSWQPGEVTPRNCATTAFMVPEHHLLVYEPSAGTLLPESCMYHPRQHRAWPQPHVLAELGSHVLRALPHGHPTIEPIYLGEPVQVKP